MVKSKSLVITWYVFWSNEWSIVFVSFIIVWKWTNNCFRFRNLYQNTMKEGRLKFKERNEKWRWRLTLPEGKLMLTIPSHNIYTMMVNMAKSTNIRIWPNWRWRNTIMRCRRFTPRLKKPWSSFFEERVMITKSHSVTNVQCCFRQGRN